MKYAFIKKHKAIHSIQLMCKVFTVSSGGYYAWVKRPESPRSQSNQQLDTKIQVVFKQHKERYGSPRITDELHDQGETCSENRVAKRMKALGIKAHAGKKFKVTTDSNHGKPISPNLLDQDFTAEKPNQKWVSDITYVWTDEGWLYLATVMDLYSRTIGQVGR